MQEVTQELIGYLKDIESFDKDSAQDADALHAYLIQLTNIQARANYLMAEYKRQFRQAKAKAYSKLAASSAANEKYYAPSLAKDFVDAQCGEVGFIYDLAERLSRSCTHTQDSIRTIISSLKEERKFAAYAGV